MPEKGLGGACKAVIHIRCVHNMGHTCSNEESAFPGKHSHSICLLHMLSLTPAQTRILIRMQVCAACVHSHRSQWKHTVKRREGKCQPYIMAGSLADDFPMLSYWKLLVSKLETEDYSNQFLKACKPNVGMDLLNFQLISYHIARNKFFIHIIV